MHTIKNYRKVDLKERKRAFLALFIIEHRARCQRTLQTSGLKQSKSNCTKSRNSDPQRATNFEDTTSSSGVQQTTDNWENILKQRHCKSVLIF